MMQVSISAAASRTTYRNERPYPFCPGCGHGLILGALNKALCALQLDPKRTVLVSDIGCQGLGDQYFITNAFHGLHGRSIAHATGIKLADPDLKVIVLVGDGGLGIGGAHLLNAARRNIGLTVIVFNNFNFGMTGGEHSVTTPPGGITATTRGGNPERAMDVCATVAANGAGLAWRGTAFDKELAQVMATAIQSECFALLDVWELCTAYYVPNNDFSKKLLLETRQALGMPAGLIHQQAHPEYAHAVRAAAVPTGQRLLPPTPLPTRYTANLAHEFRLVIAGSAGGKVRSTARMVGEAAVLSGLWASQSDDYPVTVKTGHSISELILSPHEILYTGITRPDAVVLVSEEGRRAANHYLRALTGDNWLFVPPEMATLDTPARKVVLDPEAAGIRSSKKNLGLLLASAALRRLDLFPVAACEDAIRRSQRSPILEENLEILAQSQTLATEWGTGNRE